MSPRIKNTLIYVFKTQHQVLVFVLRFLQMELVGSLILIRQIVYVAAFYLGWFSVVGLFFVVVVEFFGEEGGCVFVWWGFFPSLVFLSSYLISAGQRYPFELQDLAREGNLM